MLETTVRKLITGFIFMSLAIAGGGVYAHHSFAVFFDEGKTVSVTGAVTEFQFKNPHGVIKLIEEDKTGATKDWKVESNSPSILKRRGWKADSLKPGEIITVEGWPARDGSRYLRMRAVTRANGEVIGKPVDFSAD
jgi:hypothetical protein